jgi:hypothetical protein
LRLVQFVAGTADTRRMEDRPRPILSALAAEPTLASAIEAFVVALAERVDELQDCEAQGTLPRLAELASELSREATQVGYGPLASWADAVALACAERNSQDARKALLELTEVATRVRLGHRGAA